MKAVLCPVCKGTGWVEGALEEIKNKQCHGCGGKGWVEVGNLDDRLKPIDNISYSLPPDYNRCPACGGDRNSPAGTGCPMGSHYGTLLKGKEK